MFYDLALVHTRVRTARGLAVDWRRTSVRICVAALNVWIVIYFRRKKRNATAIDTDWATAIQFMTVPKTIIGISNARTPCSSAACAHTLAPNWWQCTHTKHAQNVMDKSKAGAHNIRCHGGDGAEVDGDNRYTRVTGAIYMMIGVICTNTCAKHALRAATRCWRGCCVHPQTQSSPYTKPLCHGNRDSSKGRRRVCVFAPMLFVIH